MEEILVNIALRYVHSRCFIVNIDHSYMWIKNSSAEQSSYSDIVVLFKEL
jgi:hypothetical protein